MLPFTVKFGNELTWLWQPHCKRPLYHPIRFLIIKAMSKWEQAQCGDHYVALCLSWSKDTMKKGKQAAHTLKHVNEPVELTVLLRSTDITRRKHASIPKHENATQM